MQNILYHGTNHRQAIPGFWPNSHFGSKLAGIDAVAAKWIDVKEMEFHGTLPNSLAVGPDKHRKLIEVELNYDISSCVTIDEDWGTPGAVGLCRTLKYHPMFTDLFTPIYDSVFAFNKELRADLSVSREDRAPALRSFSNPLITKAMDSLGVKVIKYKNIVEGKSEEGDYEYSYCVFDPTIVTIRQILPVKDNDLIKGIRRLLKIKHHDQNFVITMWKKRFKSPETRGQGAPLKRKRDLAPLIDELVPASTAALTPMAALEASRTEGWVKTAQYIQTSLLLNRQSIPAEALAPNTMLTPTELTELDFALAEGRIVPADFVRIYNGGVSRQLATPEKTNLVGF